jgi:negative regulator of flagellin synthesis FlgM
MYGTNRPEVGRPAKGVPSTPAGDAATGPGADAARVSPDRVHVRALEAELKAAPEIRKDKVEALQRRIREGQFRVEPEQVAQAMLSEMQARSLVR